MSQSSVLVLTPIMMLGMRGAKYFAYTHTNRQVMFPQTAKELEGKLYRSFEEGRGKKERLSKLFEELVETPHRSFAEGIDEGGQKCLPMPQKVSRLDSQRMLRRGRYIPYRFTAMVRASKK